MKYGFWIMHSAPDYGLGPVPIGWAATAELAQRFINDFATGGGEGLTIVPVE